MARQRSGSEIAALSGLSIYKPSTTTAGSTNGTASIQGGGIVNNGALALRNDRISHNTGIAQGASGFAQGGGIWNGVLFGASPGQLTLDHTNVDHNTPDASPGIPGEGGGLYTVGFSVSLAHSSIDYNNPRRLRRLLSRRPHPSTSRGPRE
jgi:hypothetical protein